MTANPRRPRRPPRRPALPAPARSPYPRFSPPFTPGLVAPEIARLGDPLNAGAIALAQEVRHATDCWRAYRHTLPSARGPDGAPEGWKRLREGGDGAAYVLAAGRHATVIESLARETDGRIWHHVSLARRDRDPTWAELIAVKRAFIGPDRYAYAVAPPEAAYVNLHLHCLHWWSCLEAGGDGAVLPRFSGTLPDGTETI